MPKRVLWGLIAVALIAAGVIGYMLERRGSPPRVVALLPASDAYLYFDVAVMRRGAMFAKLPAVQFDPEYAEFVRQTGFNLEKDLDEAAFALQRQPSAANGNPDWRDTGVFAASFDRVKLENYLHGIAQDTEKYRDTMIYAIPLPGRTVRVAILDARAVAVSNAEGPYVLQGIIDRHAQFSAGAPALVHQYFGKVPWGSPVWAIARPPVQTPGGNARLELPGGLGLFLPPETVLVASARYLGSLNIRLQAFATTADAAQRITDQLSAFLALFRTLETQEAHGSDPDVKNFFDSLKVSLDGNRAQLEATVPAGFMKKLVSETPQIGIDVQGAARAGEPAKAAPAPHAAKPPARPKRR